MCIWQILKVIDKCFKWKSAYHLEDITECSKFPRFLFQIFLNFILNTKTWVLLKSTSHLDRERFLSHQLFKKFSLLLRDSVLFLEIKKKTIKIQKKTRKPPLPYKILNLFFFTSELHQIYFYGLFCLSQIMYKIKCNDCLIHWRKSTCDFMNCFLIRLFEPD